MNESKPDWWCSASDSAVTDGLAAAINNGLGLMFPDTTTDSIPSTPISPTPTEIRGCDEEPVGQIPQETCHHSVDFGTDGDGHLHVSNGIQQQSEIASSTATTRDVRQSNSDQLASRNSHQGARYINL
ncbi:Oidioi.mRNA.OKI2018_I69.YSR.g17186.t1.cds [Oikopleura dioica]|uniref:Oidioi.mRNA.OKI2018_I69.YSR.g17186.t1.cds n=1 Tax=Oikopleura dioica TaxID=34765 RepID=A0ABN7SIF3_OIKDI|nr:Oidioi.mRNA.OKI2018_I69.YSR.g17186.t1.cds [Oikopleura dioica]